MRPKGRAPALVPSPTVTEGSPPPRRSRGPLPFLPRIPRGAPSFLSPVPHCVRRSPCPAFPTPVVPWSPSLFSEALPRKPPKVTIPRPTLSRTINEAAAATFEFYFPWFESARPLEITPAQGPPWTAGPQAWGRRQRPLGGVAAARFGRPRRRMGQAGRVASANARSLGRRAGMLGRKGWGRWARAHGRGRGPGREVGVGGVHNLVQSRPPLAPVKGWGLGEDPCMGPDSPPLQVAGHPWSLGLGARGDPGGREMKDTPRALPRARSGPSASHAQHTHTPPRPHTDTQGTGQSE